MYQISQESGEYADSIAMQLIRRGREEGRAEVRKLIEEERRKSAMEAKKKYKLTIRKMLKAQLDKSLIADCLDLTPKQLETYILEINEEEKARKGNQ